MSWCFATVNGRLAEIFFDETRHGSAVCGHCYVDRTDYSQKEQKMIDEDITRFHLTYRNRQYYDRVHKRWLAKGWAPD